MPRKKDSSVTPPEVVGARVVWYLDGAPRDVDELAALVGRSPSHILKLLEQLWKRDCFEERGAARAALPRSGAARRRRLWTLVEADAVPLYTQFGRKRGRTPRKGSLLFGAAVALHARALAGGHASSAATELLGDGATAVVEALVREGIGFAVAPSNRVATDGRLSRKLADLREAKGLSLRALAVAATRHLQGAGSDDAIHHGFLARVEEGALPPAPKFEAILAALEVTDAEKVHLIRTWWTKKGDGRGALDRPDVEILSDWAAEVADSPVRIRKIPRRRQSATRG